MWMLCLRSTPIDSHLSSPPELLFQAPGRDAGANRLTERQQRMKYCLERKAHDLITLTESTSTRPGHKEVDTRGCELRETRAPIVWGSHEIWWKPSPSKYRTGCNDLYGHAIVDLNETRTETDHGDPGAHDIPHKSMMTNPGTSGAPSFSRSHLFHETSFPRVECVSWRKTISGFCFLS